MEDEGLIDHIIVSNDGLLKFIISDPLEEYRVKTLLTKEPETIYWIDSWLFKNLDEPVLFWDIGSNIGIYTLYAAVKHPKLKVISFVPFFKNFIRLMANIHLNELENVIPLYIALSSKSGLMGFCGYDERYGASGNVLMLFDEFKSDNRHINKCDDYFKVKETVLQASGDDLLKLNMVIPNYVKIDVDGLELGIIEGMKEIFKSAKLKSVLIEINTKEDLIAVKNLFSSYGLFPDDTINLLENHSRKRRSQNPENTAENWVFTKF